MISNSYNHPEIAPSAHQRSLNPSEAESNRIISGLRWTGLLSSESLNPRAGNLLDTLCAQLETLMA